MPQKSKSKKISTATFRREMLKFQDARIEVLRLGDKGRPLLLLHGEDAHEANLAQALARNHQVIMPQMPGFGRSTPPGSVRCIDDLSYLYLDLLDHYALKNLTVIGFSVGGWIAAEMASKTCQRIDRMVLVGALGVKFGGPYDRDIEDIYYHPRERVRELKFHDPALDPNLDLSQLSDQAAFKLARQHESIARLCWDPYFHNPALKHRLRRITAPTLVIWGADDGLAKPDYGRAYAKAIKGARFSALRHAGHYPHVERPELFLRKLLNFIG